MFTVIKTMFAKVGLNFAFFLLNHSIEYLAQCIALNQALQQIFKNIQFLKYLKDRNKLQILHPQTNQLSKGSNQTIFIGNLFLFHYQIQFRLKYEQKSFLFFFALLNKHFHLLILRLRHLSQYQNQRSLFIAKLPSFSLHFTVILSFFSFSFQTRELKKVLDQFSSQLYLPIEQQ